MFTFQYIAWRADGFAGITQDSPITRIRDAGFGAATPIEFHDHSRRRTHECACGHCTDKYAADVSRDNLAVTTEQQYWLILLVQRIKMICQLALASFLKNSFRSLSSLSRALVGAARFYGLMKNPTRSDKIWMVFVNPISHVQRDGDTFVCGSVHA